MYRKGSGAKSSCGRVSPGGSEARVSSPPPPMYCMPWYAGPAGSSSGTGAAK